MTCNVVAETLEEGAARRGEALIELHLPFAETSWTRTGAGWGQLDARVIYVDFSASESSSSGYRVAVAVAV